MKATLPVIWITGASSGIGEGIALEYNRLGGVQLVLSARRREELLRVAAMCNRVKTRILPIDLEQHKEAENWVQDIMNHEGRVDVLINNGGIGQLGNAIDTQYEVERKIMEINYFGNVALSKEVTKAMISVQKPCTIVVTTSILGKFSQPRLATYAASKHALYGFYEGFREEVRPHQIKVVLLSPGFINTQVTLKSLDSKGNALNKNSPAQEKGMLTEVFARKAIRAIAAGKEHKYIGGFEIGAAYVKTWAPSLFYFLMRRFVFNKKAQSK